MIKVHSYLDCFTSGNEAAFDKQLKKTINEQTTKIIWVSYFIIRFVNRPFFLNTIF